MSLARSSKAPPCGAEVGCVLGEELCVATKVELFELIRRDSWHEGLSVRALAAQVRGAPAAGAGSADPG